MEIILYTVVGIALYLISDRLLLMLEKLHGEPLPQRNVLFFVLMMVLSLSTFSILRSLFVPPQQGAQYNNQEQQTPDRGDQSSQPH